MNASEPQTQTNETPPFAWRASLAFWLCLFITAGLYGLVALSPKLSVWLDLRNDFYTNQVRLVELEQQVDYLDRVATALEDDPDFALELARVDLDAKRPDDELIPLDPELAGLDGPLAASSDNSQLRPWYTDIINAFAGNKYLRATTLGLTAVVVVLAFTFLHDAHEKRMAAYLSAIGKTTGNAVRRYREESPPRDAA